MFFPKLRESRSLFESRNLGSGRWRAQFALLFQPRDLWIGAYLTRVGIGWTLYLCLIPTLPLRLSVVDWPAVERLHASLAAHYTDPHGR